MRREHAILDSIPGQAKQFRQAFEQAQKIMASMPGCRCHEIHNCTGHSNRYLYHFHSALPEVWHFQKMPGLSS